VSPRPFPGNGEENVLPVAAIDRQALAWQTFHWEVGEIGSLAVAPLHFS
jgi:hypothetical protein